jgi:hypothetical protein
MPLASAKRSRCCCAGSSAVVRVGGSKNSSAAEVLVMSAVSRICSRVSGRVKPEAGGSAGTSGRPRGAAVDGAEAVAVAGVPRPIEPHSVSLRQ